MGQKAIAMIQSDSKTQLEETINKLLEIKNRKYDGSYENVALDCVYSNK